MIAVSSQPSVADTLSENPTQPDRCDYCGLPVRVSSSPKASRNTTADGLYCCYGCRFAHAVVQERGEEGAIRWTVIRLGVAIFFTMNLMAFTMTMWSLDVYDVEPDPFQQTLYEVFRWLSMVLALPVLLLLGVPLLLNAVSAWQRRVLSTDLLIGVAVSAAYAVSAVSVVRGSGAIYFEVGAMVLVMVTLGRWIEAAGRHRATEVLDQLLTLLPESVTRLKAVEGETREETVESSLVEVGDELRIRAGERIATDGVVTCGRTTVDEQTFTGESRPVVRSAGDQVLGGTINLDGDVVVQVTAPFRGGSFGQLLETLQEARNSRGRYQQLADRVAGWFFPVVSVLAVGAFLWHLSSGTAMAIQVAMSVLLIACPCALGLATPLAVWTALSVAVRRQVLFRSGEAIERLAEAQAVCFDKTGTLTTGRPHVSRAIVFEPETQVVPWQELHELASASTHPFSQAVARWIRDNADVARDQMAALRVDSIQSVPGAGIAARAIGGSLFRLGSVSFVTSGGMEEIAVAGSMAGAVDGSSSLPQRGSDVSCQPRFRFGKSDQIVAPAWFDQQQRAANQERSSLVAVSCDGVPVAAFLLSESIRSESQAAVAEILNDGAAVHVLSGDRPERADFIRHQLQMPALQVECGLRPHQKVRRIERIRQQSGTTVMVGDGINDAPALAASDVGMALGCGADVSRDSAQVCLLNDDLMQVPWAIALARRTRQVIRQNLVWAFGYNSVGVAAAALGWLNPAIAAGLMIASSLVVISNSLRLLQDAGGQVESFGEAGL